MWLITLTTSLLSHSFFASSVESIKLSFQDVAFNQTHFFVKINVLQKITQSFCA
jgi:hypothetical protein